MTPREELKELEELAKLEEKASKQTWGGWAKAVGDEAANAFGTGVIRGGAGLLGFPATLVNLVTQGSPALMRKLGFEAEPLVPRLVGEPQDWIGLVEKTAGPLPEVKTPAGKVLSAITAGAVGARGLGGKAKLGGFAGGLGEVTTQATGSPSLGVAASTLPYAAPAAWSAFRPMIAEHTARNLLRNVTPEQMKQAQANIADYSRMTGGGAQMTPAQALPPHSQAAGLGSYLAGTSDGKALVDALVKQQLPTTAGALSPTATMQQGYQNAATTLYRQGDKVMPTRAGIAQLRKELFSIPRQQAVAPGSDQQRLVINALKETNQVLKNRPTARQLSTHADALAAQANYIPGLGKYYPVASAKVADLAQRTHPAIKQADTLVRREKELTEALERVKIPHTGGMADIDPGAVAPNTFLALLGKASGHELVTGSALARMVRSVVRGNPEVKLAEALADPTMKKLFDLAGASRIKGVTAEALRAGIQAEIQTKTKGD